MKMKRFAASDMRSALGLVRAELGPDAVILDTRETDEGVEICVAVDHELASLDTPVDLGDWRDIPLGRREIAGPGSREARSKARRESAVREQGARLEAAPRGPNTNEMAAQLAATPLSAFDPTSATGQFAAVEGASASPAVSEELRCLRQLLETQLAALAWNDFTRREPLRAQVLTELTTLGIARDIALMLSERLPAELDASQVQRVSIGLVARHIVCCASPVAEGGMLALLGPPGSGKTSTLAKLAVRWLLDHPPHTLAIVSSDEERLGSHEQLRSLGRLLQVPVYTVAGEHEMSARLASLADVPLVLVDTTGVASRDAEGLAALSRTLQVHASLKKMLVLPASAQGGVLEEAMRHYAQLAPTCVALTRMDEAAGLGGALSALIRSQMAIALQSDGPRIPEDLRPVRSHQLVARAVELSRQAQNSADEELLSRRFGGAMHDAA